MKKNIPVRANIPAVLSHIKLPAVFSYLTFSGKYRLSPFPDGPPASQISLYSSAARERPGRIHSEITGKKDCCLCGAFAGRKNL